MKKILFVAATLLAMVFTSCSKDNIDVNDPNEYCWTLSVYVAIGAESDTETNNVWATGADLQESINANKQKMDAMKSAYQSLGLKFDYNISAAKTNIASESACYEYED